VTGGTGDGDLVRACHRKLHGPIGCPAPDRSHIATEKGRIEEATPDNHCVPDYAKNGPALRRPELELLEPRLPHHTGTITQAWLDPGQAADRRRLLTRATLPWNRQRLSGLAARAAHVVQVNPKLPTHVAVVFGRDCQQHVLPEAICGGQNLSLVCCNFHMKGPQALHSPAIQCKGPGNGLIMQTGVH
jgi:hypothetical protein